MLDHPEPELLFLVYSEPLAQLVVKKQLPLYERSARVAEFFNNLLVDPSGTLAVVSCYTSRLKIIQLSDGKYAGDFDVSYEVF